MQRPPMLYRDWLSLRLQLLWCYDHSITWGDERSPVQRSLDFVNNGAWLIRSGWARVVYDDQEVQAGPGQWLIVRPGRRVQSFASETQLLSIAFEAAWPDGTAWMEAGLPLVLESADYPALERKARPMARLLAKVLDGQWDARQYRVDHRQFLELDRRMKAWMLALVDVLAEHDIHPRGRSVVDERVIAALRALDAHPVGEKLELPELARIVGLSQVHLVRLFQMEMGCTPRAYFEKRRVADACRLLRMSDARGKEVAIALGFVHLSHFSRWFRDATGQSPREFMRGG